MSVDDVVHVREQGDALFFDTVSLASGHSTYRIMIDGDTKPDLLEEYWASMQKLGCSYESAEMNVQLLAVDVPPSVDIYAAYALMEKGETDGVWSFEEGHCGHLQA